MGDSDYNSRFFIATVMKYSAVSHYESRTGLHNLNTPDMLVQKVMGVCRVLIPVWKLYNKDRVRCKQTACKSDVCH